MLKRILLTAAVLALTAPGMAIADNYNPGEKLARGIGDTATGWIEVPREMVAESNRTNLAVGVTKGTVVGTVKAVGKTVKGVVETATFLVPDSTE